MTVPLLCYNLFVVFSSFTPIFAYLVSKMSFLDGNVKVKVGFVTSLTGLMVLIIFFYPMNLQVMNTPLNTVLLYPFSILLLFIILSVNYTKNYSRSIAVSLILGFLLTELHELPAFIQEYVNIGILHIHTHPFHYLTHITTGIYFVLALKIGHVKLSWWHIVLFILVLLGSYGFYLCDPYLDFIYDPVSGRVGFSGENYMNRLIWFCWIAYTFLNGYVNVEKRVIDRCVQPV